MKGIRVDIYKSQGKDYSNGGISEKHDTVTLLIPDGGYVDHSQGGPCVVVTESRYGYKSARVCNWDGVPIKRPGQIGPMFGGTFIYSSDSRFREHCGSQPIALHDRWETQAQYDILSR